MITTRLARPWGFAMDFILKHQVPATHPAVACVLTTEDLAQEITHVEVWEPMVALPMFQIIRAHAAGTLLVRRRELSLPLVV